MKVEIKQEFHDINDYTVVYRPGDAVEFDDERAARLLEAGLAVKYTETRTTKKKA